MHAKQTLAILLALAFAPLAFANPVDDLNDTLDPVVEHVAAPLLGYTVGFYVDPPYVRGDDYNGAKVLSVNDAIDFITVLPDDPLQFEAETAADLAVRYFQRDQLATTLFTPNDPRQGEQWAWGATPGIDAYTAWDTTLGTTATVVAVLDTGLEKSHEDIGNYLQGTDFVDSDSDPQDCNGHGTHVSGTVGALTNNGIGVAGTAQTTLLPVRVLDCAGSGTFSGVANGITWAANNGADIVSMSLGCSQKGCFDQATSDALAYAESKGVLNICAAGNSGPRGNSVEFPGNDPGCMAVSNVNSGGGLSFSSSSGPEVEIAAPGSAILSTWIGNTYDSISGTSMAAPHVSGVGALSLAVHTLTGAQLRQHLKDTAVDTGLSAEDEGAGIVNAANAVGGGTAPPPPDPQCSDGVDNDGDGLTDYPDDPGCTSSDDDDETDPTMTQCNDGIDNDGDGAIDYPDDPGCTSSDDDDETDPISGSSVHTHDIDSWRQGNSPHFQVWAFNDLESAEASVDVYITASKEGGSSANGKALTGSDGSVTFKWSRAGGGTYTTCVTNMVKSGFAWDEAAGHASSGNCHTQSV